MTARIGRCIVCGEYFMSLKALKIHKSKMHRITNDKMFGRMSRS